MHLSTPPLADSTAAQKLVNEAVGNNDFIYQAGRRRKAALDNFVFIFNNNQQRESVGIYRNMLL